jgi:hypothetical protein
VPLEVDVAIRREPRGGCAMPVRTKIVSADMIPKDFVTLASQNAADREGLALLVRTRSGFIVASNCTDDPAAPRLDLFVIMPPSPAPPFVTAIAAPARARTAPSAQVSFTSTSQLVPPDPRSTLPGSELPLEDF